ncbi:MAG TPA: AmmeMemoRadiSam system protein B [Clostridiales bacterium]|nr:AmmeMemoRadiSam system protein B [Clostridiales bacterium]
MNKLPKIIVAILIIIATTGSIFAYNKNNISNNTESYLYNGRNIECLYYNATDFINIPEYETAQDTGTIRGCIVPHHLVAKDLIHEVFQNVSKNNNKTVVLIGPDHESTDKGKIFTTLNDWQTPTGIQETDSKLTKELLKYSFVKEDDDKLTIEHSASSIIPFINYYLKDVKVVTLVLTKQVKLEDVEILTDELYKNVNMDETLFIASVDFSHYLNLDEANKMDLISMEAIQNNDMNKLMSFTNDNLDSPISILTMMNIMDKAGISKKTVLRHSNSELILKKNIEETTSYITYLFCK